MDLVCLARAPTRFDCHSMGTDVRSNTCTRLGSDLLTKVGSVRTYFRPEMPYPLESQRLFNRTHRRVRACRRNFSTPTLGWVTLRAWQPRTKQSSSDSSHASMNDVSKSWTSCSTTTRRWIGPNPASACGVTENRRAIYQAFPQLPTITPRRMLSAGDLVTAEATSTTTGQSSKRSSSSSSGTGRSPRRPPTGVNPSRRRSGEPNGSRASSQPRTSVARPRTRLLVRDVASAPRRR